MITFEYAKGEKDMTKTFKSYLEDETRRKKEIIPGTFDLVFKRVLTNNREYLAEIVNGITNIPKEDIIENAEIKNSEHIVSNINEKKKMSDLIIEVKENVINLEMDREYYQGINRKNNEYIYKISMVNKDKNIVQINFLGYKEEKKNIISKIMLRDEEGNIEDDSITKYKVNLENLKEKYYNNNKLTKIEKRLLMLILEKREELKDISRGDKVVEEVNKELNELSDDKYVSLLYDWKERQRFIFNSQKKDFLEEIEQEKYKMQEEKDKMEKNLEEKEKELKEAARKEIEESRKAIAKKMIEKRMDTKEISDITGLTEDEIKKLKN